MVKEDDKEEEKVEIHMEQSENINEIEKQLESQADWTIPIWNYHHHY